MHERTRLTADERLDELFIDLPEPPEEVGKAAGAVQSGKLLFVSGALPLSEGRMQYPGRVGLEVSVDNGRMAARFAGIMALAQARKYLDGSLKKVRRVVRLDAQIACGSDFRDHEKVIDGASELFTQVFGPFGKGVRSAAGAISLPKAACISLSVIFEVK